MREQIAPRSPFFDVTAHGVRFVHVPDDDVLPARVLGHLARRGLRLLVVVLAVDQRREAVPGVGVHALPDVEDRAAGRVHEDAPHAAQPLEVADRHAERGEDHHVVRSHRGEVELAARGAVEALHAHGMELGIDVGVVDDLAHQEQAAVRKLGARLVGVLDRAVDAVAEPELAGQPEGEVADGEGVAAAPDRVHDAAVVVGGERPLDRPLQPEAAPEVGLWHEA